MHRKQKTTHRINHFFGENLFFVLNSWLKDQVTFLFLGIDGITCPCNFCPLGFGVCLFAWSLRAGTEPKGQRGTRKEDSGGATS